MKLDTGKQVLTFVCACCSPGREIHPAQPYRDDIEIEVLAIEHRRWIHQNADDMSASTVHAHVDRNAKDCDGLHRTRGEIRRCGAAYTGRTVSAVSLEITEGLIRMAAEAAETDFCVDMGVSHGEAVISWHFDTAEGYDNGKIVVCSGPRCIAAREDK